MIVTVQLQIQAETRDGPGAEDLAVLGRAADEICIMAYHAHYDGTEPGAAAPLPWVRSLVANLLRAVPARKLVLAIYVGGWRWQNGKGEQISFQEARALSERLHAERRWSSDDQAPYFSAADDAGRVEVWYEDACSLNQKLALARERGLRGIALWRLGQEDPSFYDVLRGAAPSCDAGRRSG